jgi:hypothetical protein
VNLKQQAQKAATFRGHGHLMWEGRIGTCPKCGSWVQVTTHCLPNEINIGGPAVAVDCKSNEK